MVAAAALNKMSLKGLTLADMPAPKLNRTRRLLLKATAASIPAVLALPAFASGAPIRLGVIGISFHGVVGAVVHNLLEDMGHTVQITNAPHDQMFAALGRGEVDMLITAWMPGTHSHLFAPLANRIEPLGVAYSDALLYWAVPSYVPAAEVSSIEDLTKPAVAGQMRKVIRSIGPSSGLSVRSARAVEVYGLGKAGYSLATGDTEGWLSTFKTAYDSRQWVVMPLWQPQFLNKTHDVRRLSDPKQVLGSADDAVIVASKAYLAKAPPQTVAALKKISIGLDGVTAMDMDTNIGGMTLRDAARRWMQANPRVVNGWRG